MINSGVSYWVEQPPSAVGLQALDEAAQTFDTLNLDEQVDFLVLADKLRSHLDALLIRGLAAMDSTDPSTLRWSREQAAAALRVSPRSMGRRMAIATSLTADLPRTLAALSDGRLNISQANELAARSWTLPPDARAAFEDEALAGAQGATVPETRRAVAQAVLMVDPDGQAERHRRAVEDRAVSFCPLPDGLASLTLLGRALDVEAIYSRLTDATTLLPACDPRTRDQQRADLLVDAVLAGIPDDALPTHHGRRHQVGVHVALSTLLRLDDRPGWLDGYGPLPADTVREAAHNAGAVWRRLVTDPVDGQVLQYGRSTYRPPQPLADLVTARDAECAAPGCHVPARLCDIDHVQAWSQGGHTDSTNHAPLCRRHHQLKTHGPFSYRREPDGTTTWRLGSRHTYQSRPPNRLSVRSDKASAAHGDGAATRAGEPAQRPRRSTAAGAREPANRPDSARGPTGPD